MATTYTITVQSTVDGNKYFVDGVQQDSLTIEAGQSYIFDQSDASNSGHPLALSRTDNGTHGGGVAYTNGVVVTGTAGTDRVLTFTAPNNAPASLYYYCQVHSGMGGSITVQNQTDNDPIRNFFKTLIVGQYSTTDTQLDIINTDAPKLPDPAVDGAYNLTIFTGSDSAESEFFEIVRVTAKSNDTLTVIRGQEGTDPLDMSNPGDTFGVVFSGTKKTFDDIKAEIDQAQLDVQSVQDQLDSFTVADQDLNTTDDVTFDSVTTTSRFQLPSIAGFPSNPQIGDLFINSLTNELVVFNGSAFQRVAGDLVVLLEKANATASIPQLDLGLEVLQPNATAFANDINAIALSQVQRLLEQATATSSGFDAVMSFLGFDVEYLVIAGGGGGSSLYHGGAGAGGYRSSISGESSGGGASSESPLLVTFGTPYTITVGAGGTTSVASDNDIATSGTDSQFDAIVSVGGGSGGYIDDVTKLDGGSGGGANGYSNTTLHGSGTTGQGFDGGEGQAGYKASGGGGGAGGVGQNASGRVSGDGGPGVQSSVTGTAVYRAGGGGGGSDADDPGISGYGSGNGGVGGGGDGGYGTFPTLVDGQPGQFLTGSGGGSGSQAGMGGRGGSGIVFLKYPNDANIKVGTGLSGGQFEVGGNHVAMFTNGTGLIEFEPATNPQIQALVVAGGGGGSNRYIGGGGGAGGTILTTTPLTTGTNYAVTVGAGGAFGAPNGGNPGFPGQNGNDSVFGSLTVPGGGGGTNFTSNNNIGFDGGSGGGASTYYDSSTPYGIGGNGISPFGNDGGNGNTTTGTYDRGAGGGGGAGEPGQTRAYYGGRGGHGIPVQIISTTNGQSAGIGEVVGSELYFGGGGGGGASNSNRGGDGGYGGGGRGRGLTEGGVPEAGTPNTGGGGGGEGDNRTDGQGHGGSGVIVLRYPNTYTISGSGVSVLTYTEGSHKVSVIKSGTGTVQFN